VSARENILARIRAQQGKGTRPDAAEREALTSHIRSHPLSPRPQMAWDPVARFKEQALRLASTIEDVGVLDGVPAAAARYLGHHGLPLLAVCWPQFADLPWRGAGLEVEPRAARDIDLVGITGAFCAIAETGTLMTLSGADTPATVSLLPETHIAIVPASRIVRGMEEAWDLARTELAWTADGGAVPAGFAGRCDPEAGHSATGHTRNTANTNQAAGSNSSVRRVGAVALPRAVNFISGPSRTADIEQTVTVGAHGPYRVHIILVA
jgi:L-lactate dehydrogenase complex protein LldG